MDRLVDQRTAAVAGPCAVPRRLRVVVVLAPPRHADPGVCDAPEFARVNAPLRVHERLVPARLENAAKRHAGLATSRNHRVDAGRRYCKRLFDQDRDAVLRRRKDGLVVCAGGRGDRRHVHAFCGKRVPVVAPCRAAELRRRLLCAFKRKKIAEALELELVRRIDRLRMKARNQARSDYHDSTFVHALLRLFLPL